MKRDREKKEKKPQTAGKSEPLKEPEEKPEQEKKAGTGILFLHQTGALCLMFAVCGLLLGLTNLLTEDRITRQQGERNMALLEEVLPYGGNYREIRYTGSDITVEAVYEAEGAGWVFQVAPENSYSGELVLMVGVSGDGTVAGVAVASSGETENLGQRASEPEFRAQFIGTSEQVRVEDDGGEITAISGATVTSRAVCAAVNSALNAAKTLG